MTANSPPKTDPLEDFYGPVGEPDELLVQHGQWKKYQERPPEPVPRTGRKGRPRKAPAAPPVISEMSVRQLVRGDMVDVARNWDAIVTRVHVADLDEGRPTRAAVARQLEPSVQRAARILSVAEALKDGRLGALSSRSAARALSKRPEFSGVSVETLRKDIQSTK
jgi:hypothetical protein